jgi:ClpX C4-type zinc finger
MPDDGDISATLRALEWRASAHLRRGRPAMTPKAVQSEHGQETESSNALEQGPTTDKGLCCSFCFKSYAVVKKLISNPSGTARICDECVAACGSILKKDEEDREL